VAQAKKEGQRKTAALLNFEGIATFRGEQLRGANGRKRQQQLQALCLKNEQCTANFYAGQLCTHAGSNPRRAARPRFSRTDTTHTTGICADAAVLFRRLPKQQKAEPEGFAFLYFTGLRRY